LQEQSDQNDLDNFPSEVEVAPRVHVSRASRPRELPTAVVALVATVVTAGGVLQLSRGPVAQPGAAVARVEAPAQALLMPFAAAVTPRATPTAIPAPPATRRPPARAEAGVAPRPRAGLNAETVRAIWRKTDTRSLDRGIAAVRTATLALRRCTVRVTATDRAVAHCDVRSPAADDSAQPRKAAWTIDFRRADGRWLIDNISAAAR
jgi:hypothetical protein